MLLKDFIKEHLNEELCIYLNGKPFKYDKVEDISEKILVEHYEMTLSGGLCVLCKKKGWF